MSECDRMTQMTMPSPSEGGVALAVPRAIARTFGTPRYHADGELQALAFAGDGMLWSIEDPGVLRQWHASTGQPLQEHFLSDVETLWVFSDSARVLASASDDLSLWDVASGQLLNVIPDCSWVTTAAFRPGPTDRELTAPIVATGHDDGVIRLWEGNGRRLLCQLQGHERPVSALAFSRDGMRLASAGEDRVIRIWDADTGKQLGTLSGHTDRIPTLTWHPDGTHLVSGGWDTTARVWDTSTFQPVILLNSHADQVHVARFSPDGRVLACADSGNSIHLWHTTAWKALHVLNEHEDEVRCLAFSADSRQLASGGADRVIRIWEATRGQLLSDHNGPEHHSICVGSSKSGARLTSTCGGTALRMWDLATGQPVPCGESSNVLSVAATPDGRWIAAGGANTRIQLNDAVTGQPCVSLLGQRGPVAALTVRGDSQRLASASASDGTVWIWDLTKFEPALLIIEAADGCTVDAIAYHPDGKVIACAGIDWMATGGTDGAICLWDIAQTKKVGLYERAATSLAFHPTGRWLAFASLDDTVCIWDMTSQQLTAELTGHTDAVHCVACSPDGKWLTSGGDDRTIRFWNAETLEPLTVEELDTPVKALCFSADSRYLFTGNGNTTCHQIDLQRLGV